MQPGIMPNGLFWTAQLPRGALKIAKRSITLNVNRYPLVESYFFPGDTSFNPGLVNVKVTWRAEGSPVERGKGGDVPPEDPGSFIGNFRDARATARVEGYRPGLNYKTSLLDSDAFYANMGTMRNGSFL